MSNQTVITSIIYSAPPPSKLGTIIRGVAIKTTLMAHLVAMEKRPDPSGLKSEVETSVQWKATMETHRLPILPHHHNLVPQECDTTRPILVIKIQFHDQEAQTTKTDRIIKAATWVPTSRMEAAIKVVAINKIIHLRRTLMAISHRMGFLSKEAMKEALLTLNNHHMVDPAHIKAVTNKELLLVSRLVHRRQDCNQARAIQDRAIQVKVIHLSSRPIRPVDEAMITRDLL